MWKCGQCSEMLESQFDSCWNCGGRQVDGEQVDESQLAGHADGAEASTQSNGSAEPHPLSGHDVGFFACRILAVFLGTQAAYFSITGITLVVGCLIWSPFEGYYTNKADIYSGLVLAIPTLITAFIAVVLWVSAPRISKHLIRHASLEHIRFDIKLRDIMTIGFSVAGVFILVAGFRDLVPILFIINAQMLAVEELWRSHQGLSAVLQIVIGMWLIIGAPTIVSWVHYTQGQRSDDTDLGLQTSDGPLN